MAKGLHPPDNNHTISKDLLKEEFGTELGDYNANKAFELVSEAKSKSKKKLNK
ncbi:hypothetical protein ACOI1C_09880 [Bacillus sp. DJP31]|uniref:hypothetical protein n=1 Tax=Bacillus sp. DJP31 TaxID=3409789 RepID=UPI003BB6C12E